MEDYYDILEISSDASAKQVKAAYRKKIRKYHPDVNKSPEAEKIAKLVNQAYTILSNPVKRQEYDLRHSIFSPQGRNYTEPNVAPEEVWEDISNAYKEAQNQQENLRTKGTTWTFTGTTGKSRVRKVRVQTKEGYYDIEFKR